MQEGGYDGLPDVIAAKAASRVVHLTFPPANASACLGTATAGGVPNTVPVVFGVTNFDPADPAGQPNFNDVPVCVCVSVYVSVCVCVCEKARERRQYWL